MDEKALIQRVLSGDHEAFAELVEAHEKPVYNLCLRMCGNQEDAKDLAQEAFVKAWRGLRFYKFESAFSTWLYRLTTNVCIDFLRKQKRRPPVSLTVQDEDETAVELELRDEAPLPEEQVLHREKQQRILAAMEQLEEEFRSVLVLRVVEDLTYEQIGEILDLKPGTVKSRLARARIKLKNLLEAGNKPDRRSSKQTQRRAENDL